MRGESVGEKIEENLHRYTETTFFVLKEEMEAFELGRKDAQKQKKNRIKRDVGQGSAGKQ